jgi:hypothetical protein
MNQAFVEVLQLDLLAGACDGVPFPDRTPYLDLLKVLTYFFL